MCVWIRYIIYTHTHAHAALKGLESTCYPVNPIPVCINPHDRRMSCVSMWPPTDHRQVMQNQTPWSKSSPACVIFQGLEVEHIHLRLTRPKQQKGWHMLVHTFRLAAIFPISGWCMLVSLNLGKEELPTWKKPIFGKSSLWITSIISSFMVSCCDLIRFNGIQPQGSQTRQEFVPQHIY